MSVGGLAVHEAAGADNVGMVAASAGTGHAGYDGDGGPAVDGELYQPRMMTFDGAGNMYITDTFNQVIRVVDPGGTISTVAGVAAPVSAGSGDQCPGTSPATAGRRSRRSSPAPTAWRCRPAGA